MLDAKQVTTVLEVADEQNMRAVARRLGVHPSTVTRRVQRAEALLGVRLFRRTRRFVSATPQGEAVFSVLRALRDAHRAAGRRAREVADGGAGTVRVAVVGDVTATVRALVDELRRTRPGWTVALRRTSWPAAYLDVEHHRLDVAIGAGACRRGARPPGTPRTEGGRGHVRRIAPNRTDEHAVMIRGTWRGAHASAARNVVERLVREARWQVSPPRSLEAHIAAYLARPVDEDDEWIDHRDAGAEAFALGGGRSPTAAGAT
ncbi:LysR family transcriptional regulator [Patulibacter sp. SYSU D01012]|uniref:LysR family transcriptional regulator n=1 Tax=Patulibacter sp. SYSU D01012 TaxID=2817381 RepID=UPI001B316637|nr:LysR family transcriptional regulator [Patulibacter sp. SYSU D01012]